MAMARVAAGSFDIKDNKLEFRAAGKPDEVSSIFEREVERLNKDAEAYKWTFVSVCANKSTVFVAVNTRLGWVLVFEINAIDPIKFEIIEDKLYVGGKHDPYFGSNASVKMICCSGEDQAAVLIIDNKEIGSVWLRIFSVQRDFKIWVKCPVDYNDREQCIVMIACGEMHCAALTTEGDVFTCIFPRSDFVPADLPTWTISRNWTALAFEGGDCQRALQTIVDDMDREFMYKTRSDPMAASFGVTGGLRNPYLLNINTDGMHAEDLAQKYETERLKRIEENKKELREKIQFEQEIKAKQARDMQTIVNLEEQVKKHQDQRQYHQSTLEDAAQQLAEAKQKHDEARAAHVKHTTELSRLQKQLHEEHGKMIGIKPVHTHIRSPNPPSSHTRNNPISANSKTDGFGKAFAGIFRNKPNKSENELHFEDIAHFSASRENRCTYI